MSGWIDQNKIHLSQIVYQQNYQAFLITYCMMALGGTSGTKVFCFDWPSSCIRLLSLVWMTSRINSRINYSLLEFENGCKKFKELSLCPMSYALYTRFENKGCLIIDEKDYKNKQKSFELLF